MIKLKPFFRYFGGKYRNAPHYPKPVHDRLVEPFAGAAGYACRYPERRVFISDVNPRIVGIWDYLIKTPEHEIARIPDTRAVDDLPSWVPQEAKWLVGFWLNNATTEPRKVQCEGRRNLESKGRKLEYWNRAVVQRITSQQQAIRHWIVRSWSYHEIPNARCTWFVDPPYQKAGVHYTYHSIDYHHLGDWCQERRGQVIVCEADGASWLPFVSLGKFKSMMPNKSHEVVWTNG